MAKSRQDNLIIMKSKGDAQGAGKGHQIRTYKNKKKLKEKLLLRKFNPIARAHTLYEEAKK